MARSDKAPFKREFDFNVAGILGGGEGMYVGDIKTIYIDMNPINTATGFIEGKIGRDGKWFKVPYSLDEGRSGAVDVTEVEYIKFVVDTVQESTSINMFGYYDAPQNKEIEITFKEADQNRNIEQLCTIIDIKEELIKLNTYMKIITGEDIE